MAKFLDETGLAYYDDKIKEFIDDKVASVDFEVETVENSAIDGLFDEAGYNAVVSATSIGNNGSDTNGVVYVMI